MWRQGPHLNVVEGLEMAHVTPVSSRAVIKANSQSHTQTRAALRRSQIGDPDHAPSLAAQIDLTRPTLYRLFGPHGGMGKYILCRRLTGTFRDLSDPPQSCIAGDSQTTPPPDGPSERLIADAAFLAASIPRDSRYGRCPGRLSQPTN
jgi:hypothetical protein